MPTRTTPRRAKITPAPGPAKAPRTERRRAPAGEPAPQGLARLEAALAALRADVRSLRAAPGRRTREAPGEDLGGLSAQLREFALVSPVLASTLGSVVRAVTPMPALVGELRETAERLRALLPSVAGGDGVRAALADAAERMAEARRAIRAALDTLPRDPAYSGLAAQLRELATVSPSLMDWLRQLPSLTLPLGEAIAALDQAAEGLGQAEGAARGALESLSRPHEG